MSAVVKRFWMPVAASVALAYLVIMLVTGALPERRQLVRSEAHGVLQLAPESITRVTVVGDAAPAVFVRQADGWLREGSGAAVEAELAEIIDRAVKFMHTANPVRALEHRGDRRSRPRRVRARPSAPPDHARGRGWRGPGGRFRQRGR